MSNTQILTSGLRGLAFSIADLILIGAWARARFLRMEVCLDHQSFEGEFEEVLAFHPDNGRPCRFVIWRDADRVFVEPVIGRTRRYPSVSETLEAITPRPDIVQTDVVAPSWPHAPNVLATRD